MAQDNGGERGNTRIEEGLAPVIPLFDAGEDRESGESGEDRDGAERLLLKKLGARSLSVREARALLVRTDLSSVTIDDVLAEFGRRGYLDDLALAEQLVRTGTERRGQGRQVIARTLAQRGIDRDVADRVIAELPDDDRDRALEFARSRARAQRNVPPDAALRRLLGQLSRRGYPSSVALDAARQALREADSGR